MLSLRYPACEKDASWGCAVKTFLYNCQQSIGKGRAAIFNIVRCAIFLALLPVAILPLFALTFFAHEDE